ncbi:TPA: Dam family site-specific DNA-(adenine-N6)-methyltransferase [Enterobacter hormaechei subsp. xiangfangensis]
MTEILTATDLSLTVDGQPISLYPERNSSNEIEPLNLTGSCSISLVPEAAEYGNLTYGSVCSGIEAASCAWHPLGWKPVWFSEIDDFPSNVLAERWPDVPNVGDMTAIAARILSREIPAPDILVAGTPCQAFALCGKRESLADPRGQLTLALVNIANAIDEIRKADGYPPCLIVWENVPGVFNLKDNAYGHFLAALSGESAALIPGERPDFGANSRYWRWDKKNSQHIPKWAGAGGAYGQQRGISWRTLDAQFFGVPQQRRRVFVIASARNDIDTGALLFESEVGSRTNPPDYGRSAGRAKSADGCTLYRFRRTDNYVEDTVTSTLAARDSKERRELIVMDDGRVRTLSALEYERLQGFPDDYTNIPGATDGKRFKAIGNSMAVPVMHWIGQRIGRALVAAASAPEPSTSTNALPTHLRNNRPFLKWAGGKYRVLDVIASWLPKGNRLIEPFVGAGSVFMNIPFNEYLLADINPDLINLYRQLEARPKTVITVARELVDRCKSNGAYEAIRDEFNNREASEERHAALFLALLRTCFNGLCRYNKKERFNVGWCKKEKPYFPELELERFTQSHQRREFFCGSFHETIAQAGHGDVVFCDPPYEPLPDTEGFTAYANGAFTFDHQTELVEACVAAFKRGARVVITNSGAPNIKALYLKHGFAIHHFTARRAISCNADTRGDVKDIIAIL